MNTRQMRRKIVLEALRDHGPCEPETLAELTVADADLFEDVFITDILDKLQVEGLVQRIATGYAIMPQGRKLLEQMALELTKMVQAQAAAAQSVEWHKVREAEMGAVANECFSKARYGSEELAKKVARKAEAERGVPLRAYGCTICGGWHLTKRGA